MSHKISTCVDVRVARMFYNRLSQLAVCSRFCMMVGDRTARARAPPHFQNAVHPTYSNNSPTRAKIFFGGSFIEVIFHDSRNSFPMCNFENCIIWQRTLKTLERYDKQIREFRIFFFYRCSHHKVATSDIGTSI